MSTTDPFAPIRRVSRKPYGRCNGCGKPTPSAGAGLCRATVAERQPKGASDKAISGRSATTCPECAIKWWELVEAAFDEVGI